MTSIGETVSSNVQKTSRVQFITFAAENNIIYNGYCKLQLNTLSKYLHINPLDEEIKPKSVSFNSGLIKEKNILFISSENKIDDLVLIFQSERICQKVLDHINKYMIPLNDAPNQAKIIQEHFFLPLFQQLFDPNITKILSALFQLYNQQEKQAFITFLKECGFYETVNSVLPCEDNLLQADETLMATRLRRHGKTQRYIQDDSDNENGSNLQTRSKRKKVPSKMTNSNSKTDQGTIINKPKYELLEGIIRGVKRKRLIIFTDDSRKYCEEYLDSKGRQRFDCCGCFVFKKHTSAVVKNIGQENEFVKLFNMTHICKPREYATLSIFKKQRIVKFSDFEVQKIFQNGIKRNVLFIFDEKNRDLCYKFIYMKRLDKYCCRSCAEENHRIYAKLRKYENGEEYVDLTGKEVHVCHLQPYIKAKGNHDIILGPTDFKFFPQRNTQSKLFIYDPTNKKMGYEFSHVADDVYQCLGCHLLRKEHKIVKAKLYKLKNGESSVRMRPGQEHACEMREFDSTKFDERLVYPPNFQFYLSNKKLLHVAHFISDDKMLCYDFRQKTKNYNSFVCTGCRKVAKKSTCANVQEDIDDNECIQLGISKHICEPVKYSEILKSGIKLLESSGLKKKPLPAETDERKLFKEFELRLNKAGVPGGRLITICQSDKSQCYEYFFRKAQNRYFCCKCVTVSAGILIDVDNKQFVQLGIKEHTCKPVKYEPEKPIIRAPMFKLFEPRNKNSVKKLIIFTTTDQSLCYKYSLNPSRTHYYCQACYKNLKKRTVTVKIQKDADGNEYIQQSPLDHICEPIKFDSKNYI